MNFLSWFNFECIWRSENNSLQPTSNKKPKLENKKVPLKNIKILDIGCGGGLLSEPMCRLGAKVTGIDASEKNINIAKLHSKKNDLQIDYFCTSPEKFETKDKFDLSVSVKGGGVNGQAEAIRLAISRALVEFNEEFKSTLKSEGLMTRDPRMVERKKFGQKKARKKFQFSKR